MNKSNYIVLGVSILAGATIYTQVSSDTGKTEETFSGASANNTISIKWNEAKNNFVKPSKQELKQRLSKLQYEVTQKDAT